MAKDGDKELWEWRPELKLGPKRKKAVASAEAALAGRRGVYTSLPVEKLLHSLTVLYGVQFVHSLRMVRIKRDTE